MKTLENRLVAVSCAFCAGKGKDPFNLLSEHARCGVCGGAGTLLVAEPVRRCAFCRGSGVYPGSRLTCTSCMGKGVVCVREPAEPCPACEGAGAVLGHALPCSTCGGKGLVTIAVSEPGCAGRPRMRAVPGTGKRGWR